LRNFRIINIEKKNDKKETEGVSPLFLISLLCALINFSIKR
jgi:hypothetical protein